MASSASYPLASWTLGGFRAIRDETVFDLGGLNLLVGPNSAGKSAVLHSILMAAQTLATPLADRPLVLNGSLVRLGLADDCVHEETGKEITLGFGLIPDEPQRTWSARTELSHIEVRAQFVVSPDGNEDFWLEEASLEGFSAGDEAAGHQLAMRRRSTSAAIEAFRNAGLSDEAADEAVDLETFAVDGDVPDKTAGAYARQFLPDVLIVVGNRYLHELRTLRLPARRPVRAGTLTMRRSRTSLSQPIAEFIRNFARDELGPEVERALPDDNEMSVERLAELPARAWHQLRQLTTTDWFLKHRHDLPFEGEIEFQQMDDVLQAGSEFARRWFTRSVRHLGPLRASPQPLYGLPEAASGASVGRQGEYTAAVLSAYGRRSTTVPMPDGQIREVQLSTAVDRWMAELGLLAAVRSRERGKLGFELHVRVEGVERNLDLTTVGVGVSQALPIVVLGLIAEPSSLLLFEQPELHLHPDVQAALGDFFLALARSGRQLIVETHSEYLINRLRRRQATIEESDVAELVRLFFFEREGSTSKIAAARIASDGTMPGWPRGFLDTAAREIEAMVRDNIA